MVKITEVLSGTKAESAGIKANDLLLKINGNEISDVLDYRFYLAEKKVELELSRNGEVYNVLIKKGQYDDIGLEFETPLMDEKQRCKNGCIFCFIDQNPKGLRESLYFKDDDSRLSFIHGNYITLTNMTEKDVERIIKMRFSPINISIHTTNPDLRVKMMKNKRAGEVLEYIKRFCDAGLSVCGQIVLCKGVNDGEELIRSINDLKGLYPALGSVSIVPAGLTKFRDKLYPLSDFTPEEAGEIIDTVEAISEQLLSSVGSRVFFLADEFYLKAKREIPSEEYYEGYPQIENGVGMIRSFVEEFGFAYEDVQDSLDLLDVPRTVSIATGVASYPMISSLTDKLTKIFPKLTINVYKIINRFFGESITVSGLLTGADICSQLKEEPLGEELFVPINALRDGEDVFLCGMTLSEMESRLGVKVTPLENDGYEFLRDLLGAE
jgi:putative radical SAM enzyme (TIGR03279 family)